MQYTGSCHCGQVQFEVEAPAEMVCVDCNCSICARSGYLHLILPLANFKLFSGADCLSTYTFGSGIARHTFCSNCGIKAFYTPRSNPDGIDVNVRCLNPQPEQLTIEPFDGQHWEDHAATLTHLSAAKNSTPGY